MEKAINIAKYIVDKHEEEKIPINNITLNKMLYLIQEENVRCKGEKCFSEDMQAWDFGPVVPEVYWHYCGIGAFPLFNIDKINTKINNKEIIDKIINEYKGKKPWDYAKKIMKTGSPYDKAYVTKEKYATIKF